MEKLVDLLPFNILVTAAVGAVVAYLLPTLLGVKAKVEETEKEIAELYGLTKGLVFFAVQAIEDGKLSEDEKDKMKSQLDDIVKSAKVVIE